MGSNEDLLHLLQELLQSLRLGRETVDPRFPQSTGNMKNEFMKTMPELPEITVIAQQMNEEITGKRIAEIEAKQPKNLNMPVSKFTKTIKGKTVIGVESRGKWLFLKLDQGYLLLINLGMGAELIYSNPTQKLQRSINSN